MWQKKRETADRQRGGTFAYAVVEKRYSEVLLKHLHTKFIQTKISLFTLGEIGHQGCFSALLCLSQSRSGPLLLPPYNHSWGAATAEGDPIIGAFVHNTEWARDLWERGEGLARGRESAFREESGSEETSTTSVPPPPDCSRSDGIHLNKPRNSSSTK